jgi:non-homologous end joining protein Ku
LHEQDEAQSEDDEEQEIAHAPRPQSTRTIEIERFLLGGQIDARYFEKPYYIVPREEIGQESFAVIRDAMSREGLIGQGASYCLRASGRFLSSPWAQGSAV